jgi:hypothetical protein
MATICKDVQDKIEKKVWQQVDDWVKSTERKCKQYPWWNPLGWFCWLVTIVVKVLKWILVTIVTIVIRVVCEVVNLFANIAAAVINFVLAIPIIGPIIKAILRAIATVISYVVGLIDGIGRLIGIRITKHLRVHVIPLCEGVVPLALEANLTSVMRETERIFYSRAQIRVHTTFHEPIKNPPENALRLGTGIDLIADELWLKGAWHQIQTIKIFESNLWSLIGVGQPIVVYVIREVGYDGPGTVVGASGGIFTDWVAVERDSVVDKVVFNTATGMAAQPLSPYPPTLASDVVPTPISNLNFVGGKYVIAHEICHALGLLGHANSGSGDLMSPNTITGDALSPFQVGIIRNSGHVTFL